MTIPNLLPDAITWRSWLAWLTDQQLLGLTAWGEARGDWREGHSSLEERVAVLHVVRTRSLQRRQDIRATVLAPRQFSCWTPALDGNHLALVAQIDALVTPDAAAIDPLLTETIWLAGGVLSGAILDRVKGSNYYYAPKAMQPPGAVPTWAKANGRVLPPTVVVGEQHFYRL